MKKKAIVFGGGIAGLSAAHELIERGFDVTIYEAKSIPGGKARSVSVPHSATDGNKELPGEHGFRFFPGFYQHVIHTMKRIPVDKKKTVYHHLVNAKEMGLARFDKPLVPFALGFPKSFVHLRTNMKSLFQTNWRLSGHDLDFLVERVWQVVTSCPERRNKEYESISWWDYVEADHKSEAFQKIVEGMTRSLVAAKAREASLKTIGNVFSQLLLDLMLPGPPSDRLLNGPTNDQWITPWLTHLRKKGVRFVADAKCVKIECEQQRISHVIVQHLGRQSTVKGDYFLFALPIETMETLVTPEMIELDPKLQGMKQLAQSVGWMNGVQFYVKRDIPIINGHILCIDAPWALTLISQKQFWPSTNLQTYGDGTVKGIISVCVSEWHRPGILYGKTAAQCTEAEIKKEVWAQLKRSLNTGNTILHDKDLHSSFIDPDMTLKPPHSKNHSPLLVNNVNTWKLRPDATTRIKNLFLASDYVRTNTDLASMEASNEAARRAVNGIIDASQSRTRKCKLWEMYTFDLLTPWHVHDQHRFHQGLPWDGRCSMMKRILSTAKYVPWLYMKKIF
ncbi:hydroxysqualene dehydroxylase [Bacillus sp. FJAT-42315]|uniref:hydroxysqualene dehydroxylase n=1 Tax=Bacillus sp. FJAT-42315 TaxID=2014077 RepID=UPI000C241127|nr:FAD-dependent oxidoreductase [Bacillus sp. FJAT-42315]